MTVRRVTVVIPVFNSDPRHLTAALDSLAEQTLAVDAFEVIVVDDGSSLPETLRLLERLDEAGTYRGVALRVERHAENRWLAAARVTGARASSSEYLLFLDADDQVSADYLKKKTMLLDACPGASWAYSVTQCFEEIHERRPAQPFSAFAFLLRNSVPYASVFRRPAWLEVAQRERRVLGDVRFFEDWDTTIRLMARGHFGLPLEDATFHYRKRSDGLNERPTRIYILSIYMTWRANLFRLPLVARAQLRYLRHRRRGFGFRARINPLRLLDAAQSRLVRRALETQDLNATLGVGELLMALAFPRRFIARFMNPEKSLTLAELRCGFVRKPSAPASIPPKDNAEPRGGVLFAHTWWTIGGSEKVLLEWCEAARRAGIDRILEVVQFDSEQKDEVKLDFARHTDEQYCLARIGASPRDRLAFLWELICAERPAVVFISGNPTAYALVPMIRRHLPATVVMDILHNQWKNRFDWFSVAFEYQGHIDRRIVISDHWRDILVRKYGEHSDRIEVHPNFIDTEWFTPVADKAGVRAELGIEPDHRVFTFIGRLHEQKDPVVFCEVARRFQAEAGYRFVVVGDGPLAKSLAEHYGKLENLRFAGSCSDVRGYIAASDALVFTSRYEGFPLTPLEAASMNIPIVAPDIVGFDEQVRSGRIGLLYEPTGNAAADSATVAGILRDRYDELTAIASRNSSRSYVQHCHARSELLPSLEEAIARFAGRTRPAREGKATAPGSRVRPRLLLHVGWHKTGSSTIQHFLYHNRSILERQRIVYPKSLSWGLAHHMLKFYFNRRRLPDWIREKLPTYEAYDRWVKLHLDGLARDVGTRVILSSEGFCQCPSTEVGQRLNMFDTTMLAFLRRQDLYVESALNQGEKMQTPAWQKSGLEGTLARLRNRVRDYAGFMDAWARDLGRDKVIAVPFERRQFPDGLERKFIEAADVEWDPRFVCSGHLNRRLNRDCTAFLSRYEEDDRIRNPHFHDLVHLLEDYSKEHPDPPQWRHILSPAQRIEILDEARPFNERVAREYLGDPSGILFADPEPSLDDPWEPYPGLSPRKEREIRAYILDNGGRLVA